MIRTLVVDDEAPARNRLRALLTREPDVELVGECADGPSAMAAVAERQPDLLFLDVQMPEMDGFEVLATVCRSDPVPVVVFVTAYDRYALDAFDAGAVDYLLKPFTNVRFARALGRARSFLKDDDGVGAVRAQLEAVLEAAAAHRRAPRLPVTIDGRIHLLDIHAIDRIEGARNYARIFAGGRPYLVRETLKDLAERLAPHGFVRIHQSHIVNLDHVVELRPWSHGEPVVVLRDGTRLHASRTYGDALRRGIGL